MDNVLLFLKIIKMKRNTILFILKTFHIFDNWPRLTACSLYGKLISSNRFTHVLSNYQMANKIIYIKEPIFQRLNKVEKKLINKFEKIISIERRKKKLNQVLFLANSEAKLCAFQINFVLQKKSNCTVLNHRSIQRSHRLLIIHEEQVNFTGSPSASIQIFNSSSLTACLIY